MKQVKKSVLLWYSPREMYDLVIDCSSYPKFLPWCARADVLESSDAGMTARLHLAYAGVKHAFTTRNKHVPGELVVVDLVDGPFSVLEGSWRFTPLGTPAAQAAEAAQTPEAAPPAPSACKIDFELSYAFSSPALETVVSPVFDRVANSFVDAFVKRAEQVYGLR